MLAVWAKALPARKKENTAARSFEERRFITVNPVVMKIIATFVPPKDGIRPSPGK
jgi:hypothetical protein